MKNKKKILQQKLIEINEWQCYLFQNMGISADMETKLQKDCCRKILLETSRLYENLTRLDAGMKPVPRTNYEKDV